MKSQSQALSKTTKASLTSSEYSCIHHWLKARFGKANQCESDNCDSMSANYAWSLIKGFTYEKNRKHFRMLCYRCHSKYDDSEERRKKISNATKGKPKPGNRKQFDCNVIDCLKPHKALGLCRQHYLKHYRKTYKRT